MGACISTDLPDSYLPRLRLGGPSLDVSLKRAATRVVVLSIRAAEQARIREAQRKGNNVAILVNVKVTQGALGKDEWQP
jgi:hypothetical protein